MRSYSPKHPQNQDNSWIGKVYLICGILLGLGLVWALSGCSPRIVEHIVVQHDTTRVVVRDSVTFYDRDSIFVKEKGDTVYKYVEKWRYRDRWHTDTLVRVKVDSVSVERIKEVKVEKPLTWWQRFRLRAFWWLAGLFLLLALWWTRELWGKFI